LLSDKHALLGPQIVHIAVEMAPIAKVGGMGDVVTALGRAVQEEGHQVEVILPKFDCINYDLVQVGVRPGLKESGALGHLPLAPQAAEMEQELHVGIVIR
jgi:glycogen synthase